LQMGRIREDGEDMNRMRWKAKYDRWCPNKKITMINSLMVVMILLASNCKLMDRGRGVWLKGLWHALHWGLIMHDVDPRLFSMTLVVCCFESTSNSRSFIESVLLDSVMVHRSEAPKHR
jgi:hypothetical protein